MSAAASHQTSPDALDYLRSNFGLDIVRVIRIGKKHGTFDIILRDGRTVQLGDTAAVLSPKEAQVAVADAIGHVLPNLKRDDWRPFAHAIINAAELQDVGSDPQQELKAWIEAFADSFGRLSSTDAEVAQRLAENGVVRQEDGTVYINLVKFMMAIPTLCSAKVERHELIFRLYRANFKRKCPESRSGKNIIRVRAWRSPPGYLNDENQEDD